MKKWQKYWLYFVIAFSVFHLVRDAFQFLGIENFVSNILASPGPSKVPLVIYYTVYNIVLLALIEIALAAISLKRNRFGKSGVATIVIAVFFVVLWLVYYLVI